MDLPSYIGGQLAFLYRRMAHSPLGGTITQGIPHSSLIVKGCPSECLFGNCLQVYPRKLLKNLPNKTVEKKKK